MLKIIHIRNDMKQIVRDPIMAIMLAAPMLTIVIFKLLVIFLTPLIQSQTGFDIVPYYEYVFAFVLLINTGLLGIITGFLMLDDRDGNIVQLMSVTPLGKGGYLANRLVIASVASLFYTIAGFFILNLVEMPFYAMLLLAVLSAIYTAIIGLLLFSGASDKVKGLTFAKALNILVLFAFADLFAVSWFTYLAWLFPPYWIAAIIKSPDSLFEISMAIMVHFIWLLVLVYKYLKKHV
jgi:fluoroquinolone transport system permease protein